jgi:WD40 repeat protein
VASGDANGVVKIYNNSMSLLQSLPDHSGVQIWRIKQNGNYFATCSDDTTVNVWRIYSSSNFTLFRTFSSHSSSIYGMDWLDADTLASSGFGDNSIKIWSLSTGVTKRQIDTNSRVRTLKIISPLNLAVGLQSSDISIYNFNNGSLVTTLKGHTGVVWDLAQLNASTLASSSDDTTVRIWDLNTNTLRFTLTGHTATVFSLKQITSTILASGSADTTIKLWNTSLGNLIRTLTGHTSTILWSMDLTDNGQTLVSGSRDSTIRKWNWSNGTLLSTLTTSASITSLAVLSI